MYNEIDLDLSLQAGKLIELASKNMQRDGYLIPAGVIYRTDGEAMVCGLPFSSTQDKQKCFQAFRTAAKNQNAVAVAFVSEAWVYCKSIELESMEYTPEGKEREEVIVATVITPTESVVWMAPVLRVNEEVYGVGDIRSEGNVLDAEFSRGIWEKTLH